MDSKIVQLHRDRPPIAHYLRIGMTGFHPIEELLEIGRFPMRRAVIAAAGVSRQRSLLQAMAEADIELVLDTHIPELSAIGYYNGSYKAAPWAKNSEPLSIDDLRGLKGAALATRIAEFAVEHRFQSVLAPSTFVPAGAHAGFITSIRACELLRDSLDRSGGKHIAVDFNLLAPYALIRDPAERASLIRGLRSLPFENLWIRTAGFGVDCSATALKRYITGLREFVALDHPIIADEVAGLAGLLSVAFGAVSGVAHGVAVQERFDASRWNKVRTKSKGGLKPRVLISDLDRQLNTDDVAIIAAASGRRLVSCTDTACCPKGLADMIADTRRHYLYQRAKAMSDLSHVPELRRAAHAVATDLVRADRRGRELARLRIPEGELKDALTRQARRNERLLEVAENMLVNHDDGVRVRPARTRVLVQKPNSASRMETQ